jgi:hypothetical protein
MYLLLYPHLLTSRMCCSCCSSISVFSLVISSIFLVFLVLSSINAMIRSSYIFETKSNCFNFNNLVIPLHGGWLPAFRFLEIKYFMLAGRQIVIQNLLVDVPEFLET